MDAKEIRIEFIRKDIEQKTIAKKLGVSGAIISRVIDRKAVSRPAAQAISEAIGRPIEEVFPELEEWRPRRKTACN